MNKTRCKLLFFQLKKSAAGAYRYGFNGKENDNEVKNKEGSQLDYGMRIYDTRLGRFLSVDPITAHYPDLTTYQFASNSPIENIDLDGLEAYDYKGTYIVHDNIPRSISAGVIDLNIRKAATSMQPAQAKASQIQAQQQAAQRIANQPQFTKAPSRSPGEQANNEAKIKQARLQNFMDPETGQKTAAGRLFESRGYERLNDNLVDPLVGAVAGEGLAKGFFAAGKSLL